nr:senescence associated protein [Hymenolepis microstoma]
MKLNEDSKTPKAPADDISKGQLTFEERMKNQTLGELCFTMIGRGADIEGSKSDVAMITWPPQASYSCGSNLSGTSCFKLSTSDHHPEWA